jgi:hypothetical protein
MRRPCGDSSVSSGIAAQCSLLDRFSVDSIDWMNAPFTALTRE